MQKFDPTDWTELTNEQEIQVLDGKVQLRATDEISVYAQAEGIEALVGTAKEVTAEFSQPVTLRIKKRKGTDVFIHARYTPLYETEGEVYSNMDARPQVSEHVAEVQRTMLVMQRQADQLMRQQRQEARAIRKENRKLREERDKRRQEPQPTPGRDRSQPPAEPAPEAQPDPKPVQDDK